MSNQENLVSMDISNTLQELHVTMEMAHDLVLLDRLYEFIQYVKSMSTKVELSTDTVSKEIKIVTIRISLEQLPVNGFDLMDEIVQQLKYLNQSPKIKMRDLFCSF